MENNVIAAKNAIVIYKLIILIMDMEYDAYKVEGAYDPDGIEQFRQNAYQIYKANIMVMPYESFNLRRAVQQVVEGNHFH